MIVNFPFLNIAKGISTVSVTIEEIDKIARLAHLNLEHEEKEHLRGQINQILDYVKKLDEPNTEDVQPLSHTLELVNVFRDDIPQESLKQETALANAPARSGAFFGCQR
jgi:aspartyl-tRNA(Asn)/glutamyl-tRNA(Gln) amidotransferase subunit C